MVLNNIENLLVKYENAETTLQEEAQLKAYFASDNVAPHLEHYRSLFQYFANTQNESYTKDVPLKTNRRSMYQWISVAAVTILMLGIMIPKVFGPTEQDIKDQELALATYNKTMEAFNLVSLGMNKGKDQLKTLALVSESIEDGRASASRLNEFNKATNKIFKN
ncbi:hypothetical protein [Winogradskyella immobilis]|uniref:Uncharacterized protein n=1 Tax=Winogradskyella immobilis TaxID=2816852 RepID=A0ABS8EKP5_9FLAO|nr:hypothetical protein [Winogradskyella immobilis]MCC1483587.1 hypothetical protein [Winogradskyella immobilis]MCG0015681.1 hypothetical protein [Winogradskyella immobilis]